MIARLCPYCDQQMTKKHHCDSCGSFVWKANTINTEQKYSSQGGDSWQPEKMDEVNDTPQEQKYVPPKDMVTVKKSPKKSSHAGSKVAAALVIAMVVICMLGGVIMSLGTIVSDYTDVDDFYAGDEWEDDPWIDLSYEDVSDYTENCTAYEHLDIDGEELAKATETFLSEKMYSFDETQRYFSGYYETELYDEISYEWNYGVNLGEGYDESVYISYDAVTNDVHTIDVALSSKEDGADYILMVLKDFMGGDTIQLSEIEPLFDEENGGWGYYKNCEIMVYASGYFDGYNIRIYGTTVPFDYAQEPEIQEIPAERIQEVGQECNASAHMDLSRDEAVSAIENWLEENGRSGYHFVNDYVSNMIQTYTQLGGAEYERITLNDVYEWYNDEDGTSILIEADSYSARVHIICVIGFPMSDAEAVILGLVQAAGTGDGNEIAKEALAQFEEDGYAFTEFDGLELYVGEYNDGTCNIQLYAVEMR